MHAGQKVDVRDILVITSWLPKLQELQCNRTRNASQVRLKYTCFIHVQWELFLVWSLGFLLRPYAATERKSNVSLADLIYNVALSLGSLWRVSCFGSFYFTVCKNRSPPPLLIIPQYSVGSRAVKRAKLDGSLFKFFVEQFRNPSNTSK